jgi:hypothetical protein
MAMWLSRLVATEINTDGPRGCTESVAGNFLQEQLSD